MDALLEIMRKRRSIRKYTSEHVSEEDLKKILQAGLLAPTGKNLKSAEFIVVRDRETLDKLADSRSIGAATLKGADAAIVVIGFSQIQDVWTEDCSIALTQMHLMASSLGVGSVWIQSRLRQSAVAGKSTDEYLHELLGIPADYCCEGILSLGMPDEVKDAYDLPDPAADARVHAGKFDSMNYDKTRLFGG